MGPFKDYKLKIKKDFINMFSKIPLSTRGSLYTRNFKKDHL
jgi:hypothetical protein